MLPNANGFLCAVLGVVSLLTGTAPAALGVQRATQACTEWVTHPQPSNTDPSSLISTPSGAKRGFLGFAHDMGVRFDNRGLAIPNGRPKVVRVYCSSPAHKAGLRVGDTVLSVNNVDTRNAIRVLSADHVGAKLDFKIERNGDTQRIVLVAVEHPRTRQ